LLSALAISIKVFFTVKQMLTLTAAPSQGPQSKNTRFSVRHYLKKIRSKKASIQAHIFSAQTRPLKLFCENPFTMTTPHGNFGFWIADFRFQNTILDDFL
jgi:hypothetical protein